MQDNWDKKNNEKSNDCTIKLDKYSQFDLKHIKGVTEYVQASVG